jgi:sigma-B regulation protein RsbU (phosphoserine phosphatase)
MRIFIVDDSPTAALHLRRKLEAMGHDVVSATNGQEAWKHLQERHEPLVITDWMMPGMSGPELCRQIRARGGTPYTYLILLTVKDLRKDRLEGLQAGADDFLTKPVDTVELDAALHTAGRILSAQAELQRRVTELENARAELERKHG